MFIVALVLVQQDDRTLLIQESKPAYRGRWFLPGGRLEVGELLVDAAAREVREEAGIEVRLQGLLCIDQLLADEDDIPNRLRFVFKAQAVGGALKRDEDEHSLQAGWFTRAEMADLDLRGALVERAVALAATDPTLLPLSSLHLVTAAERRREMR